MHTKVQRAGSCVAGGWKRTVVSYQHERHEPRLHAADRPSTAPLQQMCARLDVMMHTHNGSSKKSSQPSICHGAPRYQHGLAACLRVPSAPSLAAIACVVVNAMATNESTSRKQQLDRLIHQPRRRRYAGCRYRARVTIWLWRWRSVDITNVLPISRWTAGPATERLCYTVVVHENINTGWSLLVHRKDPDLVLSSTSSFSKFRPPSSPMKPLGLY